MQIRGAPPKSIQFRFLGSLYTHSILRSPRQPRWPLRGSTVLSQRWALESSPSSPCLRHSGAGRPPDLQLPEGSSMARGQLGAVLRQQYGVADRDLLGSQEHPPKGAPTQRSTHPKERLQGPGIRSSNPCPWGVNFIRLSRLPHLPGFFCSVL